MVRLLFFVRVLVDSYLAKRGVSAEKALFMRMKGLSVSERAVLAMLSFVSRDPRTGPRELGSAGPRARQPPTPRHSKRGGAPNGAPPLIRAPESVSS